METIWQPPKYLECGPKDAVLPLRTFIQETLRRSRTSYSTLQVALYYLIVIRPHLPTRGCDISQLNLEETQLVRAKQCGRRMFLAALILASKYLQDRNYSARAWSKISGLNTQEINVNEMAFLKAVDWKLHMSEGVFQKWTDLVLKYTSAPSSPGMDCPTITASPCWADEEGRKREWCDLILRLSPDLNEVDVPTLPARPLTAHIEFCAPPADEAVVRRTLQAPPPRHDTHTFRPALRRFDTNLTPAASSDVVFRSAAATPKPLSSMASVSRTATTSALAACIQEPRPAMRPSPFSAPACRRSSLGRCVVTVPPSPKAQEAAWTLNLLREAASPLSRKRSCPSIVAEVSLSSSGVTPKFRDLGRFGSPVVGGSPGERNKRVRCGWEMEGLEGMVGVAQGVR